MSLLECVKRNDVVKVRTLMVNKDKLPEHEISLGLIKAAEEGYLEIIQTFIETGADLNIEI